MKTGKKLKKLNSRLRAIWYGDNTASILNPLTLILSVLSFVYRFVINLRNQMYNQGILKQEKLACKVISVGNITVGGTGKTPTVIMLAKLLKERGYRPAVLSRGYGGNAKSPVNIVSDGSKTLMGHIEAGDEPVLIAQSVNGIPVLTGPKRTLTGMFAIENMNADILVLDDAFQHRCIFRDIDIVILNREKPFGNGFLLPRGPLREPPISLDRAHIQIWKDNTLDGRFPKYCEQGIGTFSPTLSEYLKPKDILRGGTGEALPLEYISGKKVGAVAGIGSPENFKETIESIGATLVSFLIFPDHYRYTPEDIAEIREKASASDAECILTTEKDGIRLADFPDFLKDTLILRVEMEMLPSREEFAALILDRLKE
ncbi:MAG: tetraacyldisaccharide 4'-kinase [Syntrophaceae bacterium]